MSDPNLYARALFEKSVEKYGRDLHSLVDAVDKSKQIALLDNPTESFDSKKALLNWILPTDADPEVRNLAYLLASKNELHLLRDVVGSFDKLAAAGALGNVARVTTTVDLDPKERANLESRLRSKYGADLGFDYRLDPSILGGVVIRIGDVVIDGSVSGKLAQMKQQMETAR